MDPPQTRNFSGTRTHKSAGENQKPNPKPANPKSADIRLEPNPLPSIGLTDKAERTLSVQGHLFLAYFWAPGVFTIRIDIKM